MDRRKLFKSGMVAVGGTVVLASGVGAAPTNPNGAIDIIMRGYRSTQQALWDAGYTGHIETLVFDKQLKLELHEACTDKRASSIDALIGKGTDCFETSMNIRLGE
jgi:hypothetical protein